MPFPYLPHLSCSDRRTGRKRHQDQRLQQDQTSCQSCFSSEGAQAEGLTINAAPRGSTWTKAFDFQNEGLTEHNYQAYTYDFTFTNDTKDEVSDFLFKLSFNQGAYLLSAWNGALEIHQNPAGLEKSATIPDLRDYDPSDFPLDFFTVDGESLVTMNPGDYLVCYPSSSMNAMEVPIKAYEGTTPGFIMYVPIGESIEDSTLELEYTFHRLLISEPLFWMSLAGMSLWLIARMICVADSFDAMNTNRVYRKKLSKDYILEELEKNKGRQFDPEIAEIMLRLLREDKLPSISETIPNNA